MLVPPETGDWTAVTSEPLPVGAVADWVVRSDCGAVVTFSGMVRDHSEGRSGVVSVEYEAYEEYVGPRLQAVAAGARRRWPELGRVALLHRVGLLPVSAVSVVVAVSSPHRAEAFAAGRFCIDTLKETVPVWKLETWADGSAWAGPCEVVA